MAEWYEEVGYSDESMAKGDSLADRLTASGRYTGRFTCVQPVTSQGGAHGVELEFQLEGFEEEMGKTTTTLWIKNKEGKDLFGLDIFNALCFILGSKDALKHAKIGKVKKWEGREKVEMDGPHFPTLENKTVGVVFQRELTDGRDRFSIAGFYDAKSLFTASELKAKAQKPEKLAKMLKNLKDKDSRTNKGGGKPDVFNDGGGDDVV